MKKIFSLLLLLIVCLQSFSQEIERFDKEYYLKKSKNQNTAGYTFVGVGLGFVALGGIVWASGVTTDFSNAFSGTTSSGGTEMDAGNILAIIGAATAVCSVPFFIAASKNKKKAMSISFNLQSIPQLKETYLTNLKTPSLTLKVQL